MYIRENELMIIGSQKPVDPVLMDQLVKEAFFEQDYPKFLVLLENGPCTQEGLDRCLAFAAAAEGCGHFSELLLEAGANKQYYLNGRLDRAACKGDIQKIDRWRSMGGEIHHDQDQPLRSAIFSLQESAARHLIKLGCDFDRAVSNDLLLAAIKTLDKGRDVQKLCLRIRTGQRTYNM